MTLDTLKLYQEQKEGLASQEFLTQLKRER